ncbi:hypothetical protein [Solitalea longa]|nr:hypothetical protein [Solitalea longa]
MRQLLTFIIGLFCSFTAYADCAVSGLYAFPGGSTIKQNSIFVPNGYAESQNVILSLNKKHNIYLKGGNKSKGGHISVYYKFSKSRDSKGIKLLDHEKERARYFRWTEKKLKNQYDGEIQLDYGERFYRVLKLIRNTTG